MALMRLGEIEVDLHRKAIKHLHVSVLPPDGAVRVSAPRQLSDNAVRAALVQRIPWIRKQQRAFADQVRQAPRRFISGETHYLWGRPRRLDVIESGARRGVKVSGSNRLRLIAAPDSGAEHRAETLAAFYRAELKLRVSDLILKWQARLGVKASFWGVKKMKTKWGSCNTGDRRIWLNLELAKKPPECLEYILVHELVHLLERHHNEHFLAHMDRLMPDWRERRELLNKAPLAFEHWSY